MFIQAKSSSSKCSLGRPPCSEGLGCTWAKAEGILGHCQFVTKLKHKSSNPVDS